MESVSFADLDRRAHDLLESHEERIVDVWVHGVRASGFPADPKPEAELRMLCREVLRTMRRVLKGGDPGPAVPLATNVARVQLDQGRAQFEIVVILLQGREAMVEVIREVVPTDDGARIAARASDAVNQVISTYGSVTCSICTSRQDDRRVRVESQLASMVERSQDAIVLVDERAIVRNWNPGAAALFGYSREQMIGQPMDRLMPPGVPEDEAHDLASEVLRVGYARRSETRRIRSDGSPVMVDVSCTAVRDPAGHQLGVWTIFRDVSERHLLLEAKLQAERLAMVGTMSAKLAHEVRNPLTSIVLNLDLIQDTLRGRGKVHAAETAEIRELLDPIESEVQRIHNVVDDYLRFARLPQVRLAPLDLDAFLRSQMGLVSQELQQRRIELDLGLEAPNAQIAADEAQLWQAVLNLVRNAMEAMPDGGRLVVSTRRQSRSVTCVIEDSGCGMTEDVRVRIFQPFFSTKRGGTGLGLPLTGQILEEHGAKVRCESGPGHGTRFTLEFPLMTHSSAGETEC